MEPLLYVMAILGCGFDPGQSNIYCAYAQEFLFDEINQIDIVDCNDGSHGKAFATNFNPEINLREVTQRGKYWKKGKWIDIDPLSISVMIDYPKVGERKSYYPAGAARREDAVVMSLKL